ncbi:MAG TPA: hypothetical protein VMW05_05770 [Methyloceanibacter sp.]|nr:hypothetical protein [Methyloceanibacter sp.]
MARFSNFTAKGFIFSVLFALGAGQAATQDRSDQVQIQSRVLEVQRTSLKDPKIDLGIWAGAVFLSPDVEASTTLGTGGRALPSDSQGGLALDGRLSLPLFDHRVLSLILGGRAGSMVGDAWSAAFDVMAQDLLRSEEWRSAVVTMANGYYGVDYGKLGLPMTTIEAWRFRKPQTP